MSQKTEQVFVVRNLLLLNPTERFLTEQSLNHPAFQPLRQAEREGLLLPLQPASLLQEETHHHGENTVPTSKECSSLPRTATSITWGTRVSSMETTGSGSLSPTLHPKSQYMSQTLNRSVSSSKDLANNTCHISSAQRSQRQNRVRLQPGAVRKTPLTRDTGEVRPQQTQLLSLSASSSSSTGRTPHFPGRQNQHSAVWSREATWPTRPQHGRLAHGSMSAPLRAPPLISARLSKSHSALSDAKSLEISATPTPTQLPKLKHVSGVGPTPASSPPAVRPQRPLRSSRASRQPLHPTQRSIRTQPRLS
ncbi:hypothetical protein INR49_022635 [Caranx melampygus]|nr:hypothetical protein INR49_022635 [Caranx melampygus]